MIRISLVSFLIILLGIMSVSQNSFAFVQTMTADSNQFLQKSTFIPENEFPWNFVVASEFRERYTPHGELAQAIQSALNAWSTIPTSFIHFDSFIFEQNPPVRYDFKNTISISKNDRNFPGDVIAFTIVTLSESGAILDTDILFNDRYTFSLNPKDGEYDLVAVLVHEIGHAVGLSHSPIMGTAMYPFTKQGKISVRQLRPDDICGATTIYPVDVAHHLKNDPLVIDARKNLGSVSGKMTIDGRPAAGVHVVFVNEFGSIVSAALSTPNGEYRLIGLPPGQYFLYIEPLNGPIRYSDINPGYNGEQNINLVGDFRTAFYIENGNEPSKGTSRFEEATLVSILPGSDTTGLDFTLSSEPAQLNLTGLWELDPLNRQSIEIGANEEKMIGFSGSNIREMKSGGVLLTDYLLSSLIINHDLNTFTMSFLLDGASVGLKAFFIQSDREVALLSGALSIFNGNPEFEITALSRDNIEQGQQAELILRGRGFTPDTRLYFTNNDLITTDIKATTTELSTTISAFDQIAPGMKSIIAVNADGQTAFLGQTFFVDYKPGIISMDPYEIFPGTTTKLHIETINYSINPDDFDLSFSNPGLRISNAVVRTDNPNIIEATLAIDQEAAQGPIGITIRSNGLSIENRSILRLLPLPIITSIDPRYIDAGSTINLSILGQNLQIDPPNLTLSFGTDQLSVNRINKMSAKSIDLNISLDRNILPRAIDVTLTTGDFETICRECLHLRDNPAILSVFPGEVAQSETSEIEIIGVRTSFQSGISRVSFGPDVQVLDLQPLSNAQLKVLIRTPDRPTEQFQDIVIVDDGYELYYQGVFRITTSPRIVEINPVELAVEVGETLKIKTEGLTFETTDLQVDIGTGITIEDIVIEDSSTLALKLFVHKSAALGFRDLIITTKENKLRLNRALKIVPVVRESSGCLLIETRVNLGSGLAFLAISILLFVAVRHRKRLLG